jgi:hypothetical protein
MKHEQLGEAINFYCIPKVFLGEAIANSLLAGAPPMDRMNVSLSSYLLFFHNRNFLGFFSMISNQFLPESTGSWQESTGKNPKNFRLEYCFHFRRISGALPQDTATFPHLFCRILRDTVAGIFDLRIQVNIRIHFFVRYSNKLSC